MNCPPDVAAILLEILRYGLLNARLAGWSGDAAQAAAEADHVHNIPELISDYSPVRLRYYWDVERSCYLGNKGQNVVAPFQPLWDRLFPHVKRLSPVAAAG